ncbi:HAMP domain-containing sensor histidine kinase [Wukongibacter baidiensis]|uniref:sensor histidine kinase n=1 Tax=Wukongibacter baidiensis TaxID=1723361 RepID=UPI003D7FAF2E
MKSILSKTWLAITSLVLIILLIIWLFQIGLLNSFYINERSNILMEEGHKLASMFIENNDYNTVSQEIIEEVETFVPSYGTRILIVDSLSNILFYSLPKEYFKGNKSLEENSKSHRSPEEILRKELSIFYNDLVVESNIANGETFTLLKNHSRPKGMKSILVGVPIMSGEDIKGYVLLTSPLAPIEETISILKKQLSIISLASLIIGTLLALLFAKHFTKPILKIINTSKKIAKGDFTANVALDSKDEIGVLGNTINDMAIQLGQIEKFRRDFIANVSHELKTPISLITAYAELVKDIDIDDTEDKNQYLQIVIDEAGRLNHMVEDILYLSKMEAGYAKLNLVEIPIVNLINSVIQNLDFFAKKRSIKINLNIDNNETQIYGDRDKLYQVFYNIINNAVNYSHENSQITIDIINLDSTVRIEIIDTGKGIPEQDLPYIWDRFYKVDKSRKRDDSGTGLGMAIVKNILQAHNFKYGIESEVDKGTTVWFEMNKCV